MAFEHLCGQVMTDSNGTTYIISDTFSVIYPGDAHPDVYEWSDVASVRIDKGNITIMAGKQTYHIPDRAFSGRSQFTAAKTIILSEISGSDTECDTPVEILPDKRFFSNYDIPDSAVFAKGEYNPKEIRSSLLSLVIGKVGKFLWCIALVAGVLAAVLFQMLIGFAEDTWWYLAMGTFFCAVGAVVIAYLIMVTVTKLKYSAMIKSCTDSDETVTFAICPAGISAAEDGVYSPHEIIRFGMNDNYVETSSMFIVTRRKVPLVWIPKALFDSDALDKIEQYLALGTQDK